jgi:hypothetical protein
MERSKTTREERAMSGPDYSHWHGFFQICQVYKDMVNIYEYRIKHNEIEELSTVAGTGPL